MKRERIIYYQDELNDDFAGNNIKVKPIKNNYKYIRRSWIFKVKLFTKCKLIYVYHEPLSTRKSFRDANVPWLKTQKIFLYDQFNLLGA